MMGRSPRCYLPSFVEIGLPVPEKKIFEMFFPLYGRGVNLDHVTSIIWSCGQHYMNKFKYKIWLKTA